MRAGSVRRGRIREGCPDLHRMPMVRWTEEVILMVQRRYKDPIRQAAYENARDCLYYGYGRAFWSRCGVAPEEADAIWRRALMDMAEEE